MTCADIKRHKIQALSPISLTCLAKRQSMYTYQEEKMDIKPGNAVSCYKPWIKRAFTDYADSS